MMEGDTETRGLILNVQRLSTEDGPGIRTTVFLKSCPLSCLWCHNPESISTRTEIEWLSARCIGCRSCVAACPRACITFDPGDGLRVDRDRCQGCGACAAECPSNALRALGRRIGVDELVAELVRDRAYYESSGGGVTLSGGEPLAQPDFTCAVLQELRARGIPTAVDTCGLAPGAAVARMASTTDLVLFDLKVIDNDMHRSLTGQPNDRILRNVEALAAARRERGTGAPRLWIRTPLIPGATATERNVRSIGELIADRLAGVVERWELCAFNNLCRDQYARLGRAWTYAETPLMSASALDAFGEIARGSGVDPSIVFVTGAARLQAAGSERSVS